MPHLRHLAPLRRSGPSRCPRSRSQVAVWPRRCLCVTPIRPALCPAGFRRRRQSKPKVNKGPVACAACTKPSAFLKKQDFHGYDLHKGIANVESAAACCKKCKENPGCKYWTYGTQAPMKARCWLKHSNTGHEMQVSNLSTLSNFSRKCSCCRMPMCPRPIASRALCAEPRHRLPRPRSTQPQRRLRLRRIYRPWCPNAPLHACLIVSA